MKKYFTPTILMVAIVTACGQMPPPSANNVQNGNIVEVQLEDGTRCAVFDGYKAGGLSCDWK